MAADTDPGPVTTRRWFSRGVAGTGICSFLADLGDEVPTALLPSLLTATLHAPASALGLIEGISDAAAGVARLGGGALADGPGRRRRIAVGGYTTTAVLPAAIGAAAAPWQAGILRAGAWAARGLRVPARNALLAGIVPPALYGRAYGFERAMDNLGAIGGPLLAIGLVALAGVRAAIGLSVIPSLPGSALTCDPVPMQATPCSARCPRLGRAAARLPGPCPPPFDDRPARDPERDHAVNPPGAQQRICGQPREYRDREIGA